MKCTSVLARGGLSREYSIMTHLFCRSWRLCGEYGTALCGPDGACFNDDTSFAGYTCQCFSSSMLELDYLNNPFCQRIDTVGIQSAPPAPSAPNGAYSHYYSHHKESLVAVLIALGIALVVMHV